MSRGERNLASLGIIPFHVYQEHHFSETENMKHFILLKLRYIFPIIFDLEFKYNFLLFLKSE